MDLLGSIMNSMDKPPSLSEKERLLRKKRKEELERKQKAEKENYKRFKEKIESKLHTYFLDEANINLKFSPMDQIYRSIVHEAAEVAGLISYAFGEDGLDRHVRVYRKSHAPCEYELAVRRRGDPWNEQIKHRMFQQRERALQAERNEVNRAPEKIVPNTNYKDKYAHLIGHEAALDAARKTETNKSYGFVPSENKKDVRSIEQTMADIQAKKRLKTNHDTNSEPVSGVVVAVDEDVAGS